MSMGEPAAGLTDLQSTVEEAIARYISANPASARRHREAEQVMPGAPFRRQTRLAQRSRESGVCARQTQRDHSAARGPAAALVMDTTDMTADATALHARFPHIAWHRAADLISASPPSSATAPTPRLDRQQPSSERKQP
jgi:hypothetical protein